MLSYVCSLSQLSTARKRMSIQLCGFEEIINPGVALVAAPHRFAPVFARYSTIDERLDLENQIKALAPTAHKPTSSEEKEARQADEGLRQIALKKLRSKAACYPELRLTSSTRYEEDTAAAPTASMHPRKA